MGLELSVIVPCFNEEENLPLLTQRMVDALAGDQIDAEIILVDDASRDQTKKIIKEQEKKYKNVVGVYHEVNKGIVGGWRSGLEAAKGKFVVTIDADLQYLPEDVPRLYAEAKTDRWDLVQGWRQFSRDNHFIRFFLSVALSGFLNLLFGMWLKDIKSGFILYRKEVFIDIMDYKRDYQMFQHFVTIAANAKGYRINQIPVAFERRNAGESFITQPFWFSVRVLKEIPAALAEYRFGRG